MIYRAVNEPVLARVPQTAVLVLDIGCGTGELGRVIKEKLNCELIGVTYSEAEAELAAAHLDRVLVCDLNDFEPDGLGEFNCVVCSHVLEHLYQPERLLKMLKRSLASDGILIVALPNVLFWRQRLNFLLGNFRYTEGGLMDHTHFRFFDWATAHTLLTDSGYTILDAAPDGSFPLSRFLPGIGKIIDRFALRFFPGLFGFQFVFVCRQEHIQA